tara:strand:- start:4160 stop:4651 length:492 start_codon:yes stop_codon:yes gene_type:complete
MSSQDLIQYLEKEQFSAFPGGAATGIGLGSMNRRREEVFLAGGTVAVGDIVSLEIAATSDGERSISVVKANSGASDTSVPVGVVIASAETDGTLTDGSRVVVCTRGICNALLAGGIGAGAPVTISGVAGQGAAKTGATEVAVGQALAASGGGGQTFFFVRASY